MESHDMDLLLREEYESKLNMIFTEIEQMVLDTIEWENLEQMITNELRNNRFDLPYEPDERDILEIVKNAIGQKLEKNNAWKNVS